MTLNSCILIGLTGGISTGKSTVSKMIIDKGYSLIDADKISREVVETNKPAYIKIVEEFGEKILLDDKSIDRKALGKIIFSNKECRERLNTIIHPYIFESIRLKIDELSLEKRIVFLDIPLLFEQYDLWEKYNITFDEIWLVYLEKDIQIERLMKRDGISKEEALKKMQAQMDINYKKARSSKTIDNSGDVEYLKEQVDKLLKELI
ncbi:dephospho-CoA kinase [Tissierella carlieri]|uniref:Dephospho-CoA kinase n=1 Tax=Tissierella carlieri TaxID=689904 RepID=A0ABT1SB44_9FIRM|nr:dephospho-CoA kinase [Tissierella carlieri]MBU5311188.1 dephospho-CoA kinase [Tissierella carlieri]MCQ4923698.1 dephospho-CoA kinase [Tissierella carlieri]